MRKNQFQMTFVVFKKILVLFLLLLDSFIYFFKNIYLHIYLALQGLSCGTWPLSIAACGIFSCGLWDPVP